MRPTQERRGVVVHRLQPQPAATRCTARAVFEHWLDLTAAKDLDGPMEHIGPDIVSYQHGG